MTVSSLTVSSWDLTPAIHVGTPPGVNGFFKRRLCPISKPTKSRDVAKPATIAVTVSRGAMEDLASALIHRGGRWCERGVK